jgi:hypothetical protein
MDFTVADKQANPVQTTFSLSVRDGADEVDSRHNVLTDLLLMSEIKGYVRNPSYYFEENASDLVSSSGRNDKLSHLDLLLMVQGWRRYSWEQMAGIQDFEMKYFPEQGIEVNGEVVATNFFGKQTSKPKVDVGLFLLKKGDDIEEGADYIDFFVTDSLGRFFFVVDVPGMWNMIFSVTEKRQKKNYRVVLDRLFSPDIKRYNYFDMQLNIAEEKKENLNNLEIPDFFKEDSDQFLDNYIDSLTRAGIDKKIHTLPEVKITAKKKVREQQILFNRSTSIAYYDVPSEMDNIYDKREFMGNNIHQLLKNMNKDKDFYEDSGFDIDTNELSDFQILFYRDKKVLFIVNYKQIDVTREYFDYNKLSVNAIKSIYINENKSVIASYIANTIDISSQQMADSISCVVFIETYPEGTTPAEDGKGIRKTRLEGYSRVKEFYSPDYAVLPIEPDDRFALKCFSCS